MSSAGSALGGVGGALVQGYFNNQASSAAKHGAQNAEQAINQQEKQGLGYLSPYLQAGNLALSPLTGLLTGNQYDPATGQTTSLTQGQRNNLFQTSPGYQFDVNQGLQALQNSQVASGNLLSGGAAKEITQYSQGLASNEYNNYINQLYSLAGIGQNAANTSAGVTSNAGNQLANYNYLSGLNSAIGAQNQGKIYGNAFSSLGALSFGGFGGTGGNGGASSGGGTGSAISPDVISSALTLSPYLAGGL